MPGLDEMGRRAELLRELIELKRRPLDVAEELTSFGWDCAEELVQVRRDHVVAVLQAFLRGNLPSEQVAHWADAVEGRDDLAFTADVIAVITELANPVLYGPINEHRAREIIADLSK